MIVDRSRGNMQIGWRQLIHHEDTAMPMIHPPFMRPCQPRIMEEKKIAAVMCDHDQAAIRSKEQLPWIRNTFTPLIMYIGNSMTIRAKQIRKIRGDILIEEERRHYGARFAASRASIASFWRK